MGSEFEATRVHHACRWRSGYLAAGCARATVRADATVGLLVGYSEGDAEGQASIAAFRQRLRELGWIEGRNIQIELRWAAADPDKARNFATELVGMAPDVIVSSSNLVTEIVQQETHTVPVVFVFVGDPVGSGFVKNVARPGGNLTGFPVFVPLTDRDRTGSNQACLSHTPSKSAVSCR